MGWLSPTGASGWTYSERTYDDNESTYGYKATLWQTWSAFITITVGSMLCAKVRFLAPYLAASQNQIDLDVLVSGSYVHVYDGTYDNLTWVEKTFTVGTVTGARIRFFNNSPDTQLNMKLYEFDFFQANAFNRTCSDIMGGLEANTKFKGAKRTSADKLGGVEGRSSGRYTNWLRTVADKFGGLEGTSKFKGAYHTASDSMGGKESVPSKFKSASRTVAEKMAGKDKVEFLTHRFHKWIYHKHEHPKQRIIKS